MTADAPQKAGPSQSDKFRNTARELECDEDETRWDERLKKVAKGGDNREADK